MQWISMAVCEAFEEETSLEATEIPIYGAGRIGILNLIL